MKPAAPMLTCFAVGALLVVLFDSNLIRILGALLLAGFIVSGVFLIASPAFLEEQEGSDDPPA